MGQLFRQRLIIAVLALAGACFVWVLDARSRERVADLGFWIEPVAFASPAVTLSEPDLQEIESRASAEIARAFSGLRVNVSSRRDASYRVQVVSRLQDLRFRKQMEVAGESRAVAGFGGAGRLSFTLLASNAIGYSAPGADRSSIIAAIATGIGRAAVHEFAHQLLPKTPIHASRDVTTYEYYSAGRREQYFGEMRWGPAWPQLAERLSSPAEQSAGGAVLLR